MTRWPRLRVRRPLVAWISVTAIGAVLLLASQRPSSRAARGAPSDSQIADRRRAAEQAASLLTTAPNPVQPDPSIRSGADKPVDSLEDLQAFARSWSKSAQAQRADPLPAQVARHATGTAGSALPANKAPDSRPPIPAQIERAAPPSNISDAFQSMTLQANLILTDSALLPLSLRGVRIAQSPPQARLGHLRGPSDGDGAWFELGDTPTPGWMLVGVDTDSATLMSTHGDLVQLSLDPANAQDTGSQPHAGR